VVKKNNTQFFGECLVSVVLYNTLCELTKMYFASQFPVIIKETSGVLFKGIRGRGKGIDIETLQKPLPLVRGRSFKR